MRLIRMLAYATLGFVIYELYQGMREGALHVPSHIADENAVSPDRLRGSLSIKGNRVITEDGNGTSVPHAVGRGVVRS